MFGSDGTEALGGGGEVGILAPHEGQAPIAVGRVEMHAGYGCVGRGLVSHRWYESDSEADFDQLQGGGEFPAGVVELAQCAVDPAREHDAEPVQSHQPAELEYGGSKELEGLARALDNARIFREFKNDDRAAFRAVNSALRKYGDQALAVDRALALATLIELATALPEGDKIEAWVEQLQTIQLTEPERRRVEGELRAAANLGLWPAESTTMPNKETDPPPKSA